MHNLKYHIINLISVILFSYILASTINQFVRLSITPAFTNSVKKNKTSIAKTDRKDFEEYKTILESNFFKLASEVEDSTSPEETVSTIPGDLKDLTLLGTISGPASIARALVRKKREKSSELFKLWNDVYGYKLVRIDNSKIYLKKGENVEILDMYAKDKKENNKSSNKTSKYSRANGEKQTQTISRSEIQQKVLNNLDNALKGLRAGPYRVNGKIEGYKLFRVRPSNILYKFGARSGDIARRINGHPINSTEKLLGLWTSLQGESKITVDLERGGKLVTFDFNVTD